MATAIPIINAATLHAVRRPRSKGLKLVSDEWNIRANVERAFDHLTWAAFDFAHDMGFIGCEDKEATIADIDDEIEFYRLQLQQDRYESIEAPMTCAEKGEWTRQFDGPTVSRILCLNALYWLLRPREVLEENMGELDKAFAEFERHKKVLCREGARAIELGRPPKQVIRAVNRIVANCEKE